MNNFYIRQKVVCVDAYRSMGLLQKDQIYEIEGFPTVRDEVGIMVVGISMPDVYYKGFKMGRFKPATDISELKALLAPTPTRKALQRVTE